MKQGILKLLLDKSGQFVSGEEISEGFKVSRTAVWKQINNLKEAGYHIESSPRQGYRLVSKPDVLIPEEMGILLEENTRIFGKRFYSYESLDSTNDLAKKLASQGEAEGTVIASDAQLKGRGRRGRPWSSAPGLGLWFSVIFRPDIKPASASQLTFVIAVAVCRALRKISGLPIAIKWPNDLLLENRKVCGILTELSAEIDQINYVVAGIGINVNHKEGDFAPELKAIAGSLALFSGKSYRRVEVLAEILKELEAEYLLFLQKGFPKTADNWREYNCTLGEEVLVVSGEEQFTGIAVDVNAGGHLLVKTQGGLIREVMAGDVSLRRLTTNKK